MKEKYGEFDNAVMNKEAGSDAFDLMDLDTEDFEDSDYIEDECYDEDGYYAEAGYDMDSECRDEEYIPSPQKKPAQKKKSVSAGKKNISSKKSVSAGKKGGSVTKNASRRNVSSRKRGGILYKIKNMDTIDRIVASTGVLIMVFAVVTCTLYANAKVVDRQVASFREVGAGMDGIEIIGESGLIAVADAQAARVFMEEEAAETEPEYEEKELEAEGSVKVKMHLSSMQKDLKIKFINEKTGKLVASVPFEVSITDADKKTYKLKDDDKDGIIYKTDMTPGKCSVTMESIAGAEEYSFSAESVSVTIKDKIEYKKVDVSDEVKKESDVNAAIEDTKKQDTTVESVLTDTVAWVESTKTPVNGNGTGYEEVAKGKITDPSTLVKADGFMRFAAPENGDGTEDPSAPTDPTTPTDPSNPTTPTNPTDPSTPTDPATPTDPPAPTEIKVGLSSTSLSLKKGETASLTATTDPAGNSVEWNSSNKEVASVSGGTVTALKAGTTDITAKTSTGHMATCTVTVTEPEKVKPTITISASTGKVLTGKTFKLTAEVKSAENTSVTWSSGNTAVATVSGDGTVTGVSAGAVTIKVVSNADNSVAATCDITVRTNPEKDNSTKLKDNDGNQLYIKDGNGNYREAVYSDYYTAGKFYKKAAATEYKYTGWQTIDGKTYYFTADGNKVTGEQVIKGAKYNFDSTGALSASSGNMGIDVSKWNGNIDWNAVKNSGVSYVIIRCGYRGSTTGALIEDPKFKANIKGATAAGLKVGVYFFTQAVNEVEAVEEASMVAGLISGYKISYPVFLDVEPSGGRADGISKDARTAVCKAFCQTIQNSGYTAGIYANKTWLTSYINTASLTSYKIWLAQYAAAPSYTTTRYDMWQYSSKGSVAGISGNVDLNISYLGY